jgi:hypothetical protein
MWFGTALNCVHFYVHGLFLIIAAIAEDSASHTRSMGSRFEKSRGIPGGTGTIAAT